MKIPKNDLVVLDIAGNSARVMCDDPEMELALGTLGFLRDGELLIRRVKSDADRQDLVHKLIGFNALFASGRDWSPSELMDFYREQGMVTLGYRVITWLDPEHYEISKIPDMNS